MSMMQEQQRTDPVFPPDRTRRLFPKEFKADAVALVLDEAGGRGTRCSRTSWLVGPVSPGATSRPMRPTPTPPGCGPTRTSCRWPTTSTTTCTRTPQLTAPSARTRHRVGRDEPVARRHQVPTGTRCGSPTTRSTRPRPSARGRPAPARDGLRSPRLSRQQRQRRGRRRHRLDNRNRGPHLSVLSATTSTDGTGNSDSGEGGGDTAKQSASAPCEDEMGTVELTRDAPGEFVASQPEPGLVPF